MKVELPFLAEGIEGGDVVQILVHEGDQVTFDVNADASGLTIVD